MSQMDFSWSSFQRDGVRQIDQMKNLKNNPAEDLM